MISCVNSNIRGNARCGKRVLRREENSGKRFPGLKCKLSKAALGGKRGFRQEASGIKRVLRRKHIYTSNHELR